MPHITTCPRCGACYQESSEEESSSPNRCCKDCWTAAARKYQERVPAPEKRIANTCRSCGAEIQWARTRSGKSMPVNAETWEPGDEDFQPKKHVSHFATCVQAAEHRRAR